jgi:hypothetical protein
MTSHIACIDGDWIVYAAGFAGQKAQDCSPDLHDPDGQLIFKNLTELAQAHYGPEAKPRDIEPDVRVFSRIVPDPVDHVLHSAKNMLIATKQKIIAKFPDVEFRVFLDADGNFRERLATIAPYKGNRVAAKPVFYPEIRQYLTEKHDAMPVYDQETDDEIAQVMTHHPDRAICVAVDKDMLQVPGIHFNPNKGWRVVSELEGLQRLYAQCLSGDPVDNIKGCYKIGSKGAQDLILPCTSEAEMWAIVTDVYAKSADKYGDEIYNGLHPDAAAIENMRLVYLKRDRNAALWTPPGLPLMTNVEIPE